MGAPALKQLHRLQQSLYEKAYAEARSSLGSEAKSIINYSRRFEASLPNRFEYSNLKNLMQHIENRRVILCGDFHSHKQAQRGFLRIIRNFKERNPETKIVLALEMFRFKDQTILDAYMDGRVDDKKLMEKTEYETFWGFPWKNYQPILEFAQKNNVRVIGLNSKNAGRDSLTFRDRFGAQLITSVVTDEPDTKVFCLVGEYHLADEHLPAALESELSNVTLRYDRTVSRIVFNVDKYYFQIRQANHKKQEEYLRLRSDLFCVINSTPWVKWQSHSIWEESKRATMPAAGHMVRYEDEDDDSYTEEEFDSDYHFLEVLKNLRSFFDLKISESDLTRFNVTKNIEDFFSSEDRKEPNKILDLSMRIAMRDGWYVDYNEQTVLLSSISVNNLAEAAGQFLHLLVSQSNQNFSDASKFFLGNVFKYALSVLSAKILNPRRPTADLKSLIEYKNHQTGRRLIGQAHQQRLVVNAVLSYVATCRKESAALDLRNFSVPKTVIAVETKCDGRVSEMLGQLIGNFLYDGVITGSIAKSEIRGMLKTSLNNSADFIPKVVKLIQSI